MSQSTNDGFLAHSADSGGVAVSGFVHIEGSTAEVLLVVGLTLSGSGKDGETLVDGLALHIPRIPSSRAAGDRSPAATSPVRKGQNISLSTHRDWAELWERLLPATQRNGDVLTRAAIAIRHIRGHLPNTPGGRNESVAAAPSDRHVVQQMTVVGEPI